jgi:hypothetical protein
MTNLKKSFYPNQEIENMLSDIPRGQISERINDLLMKGLSLEKQLKIKEDYERFNELVAQARPRKNDLSVSTTTMMSAKAFEPEEDETEDFF